MPSISFDLFYRDHGVRRGSREAADEFDRTADRSDKMHDAVKAGALVAGAAVLAFGKQAIDVASDVSESQSKVSVVFGKSAKSILDFADKSADGLGISKQAALEAAGTFGNLFVSLKLPQAEAAKMSTKMITLAADMASFSNSTPEEALEAIRSGLVGETEPLRRFGVNMNDATLRTQAMKMGLIRSVKEGLSPAVKAQAAYGLMLEQTKTAQGDFGRTSDGLANQQRRLKARFSDLQAELGAKLLPVVTKVMDGLLGLLDVINKNQHVIVPMATACVGLAVSIWAVNKAALGATRSILAWNTVLAFGTKISTRFAAANYATQMSMIAVGTAGALAATGMAALWAGDKLGKFETATVKIDAMTEAMKSNAYQAKLSRQEIQLFSDKGIFGLGKDTLSTADALERFGDAAFNALDQGWDARLARMQSLGGATSSFRKQTEQLDASFAAMVRDGAVKAAQQQMAMYEKAATDAGVPVASLRKMFPEYAKAVAASNPPIVALTHATIEHSTKVIAHTRSLYADITALLAHAQATLKARAGENSYEASLDDATKALKDNGRTLDKHTEKGRTNRQALDQIAASTLDWRDAAKQAGASQKRQTEITMNGRAELVRMAKRFGMTGKEAREYAREVLGIPKKVSSKIVLSLQNNIPNAIYGVRVAGGSNAGGITTGMATGGRVWGAGTETSDSIPAMLSHNEHVLTAREVRAFGGHSAVERMRKDAVRGFAGGGGVFSAPGMERALVAITGGTSSRLAKVLEATAAKAIGYNPLLAGGLDFARSQAGKPYIWGAVGPNGYDCSGIMSAVLNVVQGIGAYQRRFTTDTFPSQGFIPGPGSFMIGRMRGNPGHMAGTVNGVNVESASAGVRVGAGARGARDRMFAGGLYHLKGYALGGRVGDAPFDYLSPRGDSYLGNAMRKAILARMPAQVMDSGGWLPPGRSVVDNRTGAPEPLYRARGGAVFGGGSTPGSPGASAADSLTAQAISETFVRALGRGDLRVVLDGNIIGRLQGRQANLLGRA